MSLVFNMQSRLVIAFLPRSKCLLISWLELPSTEILEHHPTQIKSFTISFICLSICHEVMGLEMARVNIDILGISKLKWTGMGEFNSDDHYIYYCRQESLRRNGVAIMVNKKV